MKRRDFWKMLAAGAASVLGCLWFKNQSNGDIVESTTLEGCVKVWTKPNKNNDIFLIEKWGYDTEGKPFKSQPYTKRLISLMKKMIQKEDAARKWHCDPVDLRFDTEQGQWVKADKGLSVVPQSWFRG